MLFFTIVHAFILNNVMSISLLHSGNAFLPLQYHTRHSVFVVQCSVKHLVTMRFNEMHEIVLILRDKVHAMTTMDV